MLSKRANLLFLIIGYAIGQGCLFVVSSYLLLTKNSALLGLFGLAFTFTTLLVQLVDFGGTILLANAVLDSNPTRYQRSFASLTTLRLVIAIVIVAIIWSRTFDFGIFYNYYFLALSIGLIAAALNPAGIMDGVGRSGISGLVASLPILFSAGALPLIIGKTPQSQGFVLGASYAIGTCISVFLQFVDLHMHNRSLKIIHPRLKEIQESFSTGLFILSTQLPGQLFYRAQALVAANFLSASLVGVLVYSKQVLNGFSQLVFFIRRVEYPTLVSTLLGNKTLQNVVRVQLPGIVVSCIAGFAMIAVGISAAHYDPDRFYLPGILTALFGPVAITGAAYAALSQAFTATHNSRTAGIFINLTLFIGIIFTLVAVKYIGVWGFPMAEGLCHLLATALMARHWHLHIRRRGQISSAR